MGTTIAGAASTVAVTMEGDGCELRDVTVKGTGTGGGVMVTGAGGRVTDVSFVGTFGFGYAVQSSALDTVCDGVSVTAQCGCAFILNAPRYVLRDCKSFDTVRAVKAVGARGVIVDCTFQSAAKDAQHFAVVELQGGNTRVNGCVIGGPVAMVDYNPPVGLLLTNGWGQRVSDCFFHDVEYGVSGDGDSWHYTQLCGNHFENATRGIWHVTNGDIAHCEISHNTFRDRNPTGVWYALAGVYLDAGRVGHTSVCDNRACEDIKLYSRMQTNTDGERHNDISGNRTAGKLEASGLYSAHVSRNAAAKSSSLWGVGCKFLHNIGNFSYGGSGNAVA
jgi:hypothetical protein